jgi:mRNA-degrading endonuclease RelE of RelBE toxin-antitoxin system
MTYSYEFSEDFSETLAKIKKKDKLLFERVSKKILEIVENPLHYKPLKCFEG